MKRIFLFVLLSIPLIAGNRYIDGRVASSGNGQSWATAWKTFSNIVWNQLSPGDTLFVSGGTDSVVYSGQFSITDGGGTQKNPIHIFAGGATHITGHNGRAIINGGAKNIYLGNSSKAINGFWIKGFELQNSNGDGVHIDWECNYITLDSLKITKYNQDSGDGFGIRLIAKADSIVIRYCYIIDMVNGSGQSDCIHINSDGSWIPKRVIAYNNVFRSQSQDPVAHNDAFQSVSCDGFILYNNLSINDSVFSHEGGGMPFILSDINWGDDNPVIVFNNFCYMGGAWYGGANYGKTFNTRHDKGATSGQQPSNVFVFNNTFLSNGPRNSVIEQEYLIHFLTNNILASWCPDNEGYPKNWRQTNTYSVSGATNATPIVITVSGGHPIQTGDFVVIEGAQGNTAANGEWFGTRISSTQFSLNGSHGNGTYTGGGVITTDNHGWHGNLSATTGYGTRLTRDSVRSNLMWRQGNDQNIFYGSFNMPGGGTQSFSNWSQWVSAGGTGVNADPKLVSNIGQEPNQGALKPDLQSNSPAIDAGEDLTYLINYLASNFNLPDDVVVAMSKDIYGNDRGNGSGWDIGAVEFQQDVTDTIPSFSFTNISNAEIGTVYTGSARFTDADSTFNVWTTTGSSFKINYNGTSNTSMKTANANDTVYVSNTSSNNYSTKTTSTIIAGGVSRNFEVTTKADDTPPPVTSGKLIKTNTGLLIRTSDGKLLREKE